ncbi:MAG: hypothetical protein QGF53_03065 [Alphaproteobacteria bacterium]|nr:hypothetical protein [Alphaproteobacteria bacterium]
MDWTKGAALDAVASAALFLAAILHDSPVAIIGLLFVPGDFGAAIITTAFALAAALAGKSGQMLRAGLRRSLISPHRLVHGDGG